MAKKFILISFLGNAEYEDSYYIFDNSMDFLPIKDKKTKAKCSFQAIKENLDIEKTILFLIDKVKEKFQESCEVDDQEIKDLDENESFNDLIQKLIG